MDVTFTVSTTQNQNAQVTCNNANGQSYHKNLNVSYNPDETPTLSGSEFTDNTLLIYITNMEFHNFTTASFITRVINPNGNLGPDIQLTNPLNNYDSDTKSLTFSYDFQGNLQYVMEIKLMTADGYQYVMNQRLLFANLSVSSTKKFYTIEGQPTFDVLHHLMVDVDHQYASNIDYYYIYFFDGQEIRSGAKPTLKYRPSKQNIGCYNITTTVTALNTLSTTAQNTVCFGMGINVTLDVKLAQSLGKVSVYEIRLFDAGANSCLMVETGDGKYFVLYRTGDRNDTLCSG